LGNDRLAGYGRNAFTGPDYATMDLRLGRTLNLGEHLHLQLNAESFNLFNRDNQTYQVSDNGYYNLADSSSNTRNTRCQEERLIPRIISNLRA